MTILTRNRRRRAALIAFAVTTALIAPGIAAAQDVGVLAAVNRDITGQRPTEAPRSLLLKDRLITNERITTNSIGGGQVMFLDQVLDALDRIPVQTQSRAFNKICAAQSSMLAAMVAAMFFGHSDASHGHSARRLASPSSQLLSQSAVAATASTEIGPLIVAALSSSTTPIKSVSPFSTF